MISNKTQTTMVGDQVHYLRYLAWDYSEDYRGSTSGKLHATPEEAYAEIRQTVKEGGYTWDRIDYETVEMGIMEGTPAFYVEEIKIHWTVYHLLYACNSRFEELLDNGILKNYALLRAKINEVMGDLNF